MIGSAVRMPLELSEFFFLWRPLLLWVKQSLFINSVHLIPCRKIEMLNNSVCLGWKFAVQWCSYLSSHFVVNFWKKTSRSSFIYLEIRFFFVVCFRSWPQLRASPLVWLQKRLAAGCPPTSQVVKPNFIHILKWHILHLDLLHTL